MRCERNGCWKEGRSVVKPEWIYSLVLCEDHTREVGAEECHDYRCGCDKCVSSISDVLDRNAARGAR